jgi:hypothetical protein
MLAISLGETLFPEFNFYSNVANSTSNWSNSLGNPYSKERNLFSVSLDKIGSELDDEDEVGCCPSEVLGAPTWTAENSDPSPVPPAWNFYIFSFI